MADELLFGSLQKGGGVKIDVDKNDPDKLSFKFISDPKPTTKEKNEPEAVE
jgi:ATP-dependent Clp protease ATP-binding subunit ClpA